MAQGIVGQGMPQETFVSLQIPVSSLALMSSFLKEAETLLLLLLPVSPGAML